jgi:hypothetical protein
MVRLIAERALERLVPTVLLHVGDYDPSGVAIFSSIAADAAAFVEADRIVNTLSITPIRVALTAEQVDAYDLPTAPAKTSDSRAKNWEGSTCQLEALAPDELAEIVRVEIERHLSLTLVELAIRQEDEDRVQLTRALPRGTT